MCSRQNLQNRNKENPIESTSVVPAKYPSKIKLERVSATLECQSWEKLYVPWFVRNLGFLQWYRADLYFLIEKVVPYREDPLQCSYIVRIFSCKDSSNYGWVWDARHFHIRFLGEHLGHVGATWLCTRLPRVRPSSWNSSTMKSPTIFLPFHPRHDFLLSVLWLLCHLDRLFWQRRHLWLTLLIGSFCLGIYPY